MGTIPHVELIERASLANPALRIIFISSGGAIYGNAEADAASAEDDPLRPISPYGLGKLLSEEAIRFVHRLRGQPYAILRVANPIGRWHENRLQGLVPAVIRAIRDGGTVTIFGDGSLIRDYVDADDVADAIVRVSMAPNWCSGTWNVGSQRGRSILDIINVVGDVVGAAPKLTFAPVRPLDVRYTVLNCAKIARDFGWHAATPIRDSVHKAAEGMEAGVR